MKPYKHRFDSEFNRWTIDGPTDADFWSLDELPSKHHAIALNAAYAAGRGSLPVTDAGDEPVAWMSTDGRVILKSDRKASLDASKAYAHEKMGHPLKPDEFTIPLYLRLVPQTLTDDPLGPHLRLGVQTLTDEEIDRLALKHYPVYPLVDSKERCVDDDVNHLRREDFKTGLRYARDNGYLSQPVVAEPVDLEKVKEEAASRYPIHIKKPETVEELSLVVDMGFLRQAFVDGARHILAKGVQPQPTDTNNS